MMTTSQQAYKRGYDQIEWKPQPAPERRSGGKSMRADFPIPMMIRDFDEPVQSMADGKWYGSKADLARSHKASGNPHGQDFIELGNEQVEWREQRPDRAQDRSNIKQAINDYENGWRPEIAALD